MPPTSEYRPHLPSDPQYLQNISTLIIKNEPIEEIKFNYLKEVLELLDIKTDPYTFVSPCSIEVEKLKNIAKESFEIINHSPLTDRLKQKLYLLWNYLKEEDALTKADLIFVFGGEGLNRINEAIKLYKEGWGEKIMFSGNRASYMTPNDIEKKEGDYGAEIARENGVKEKDLIVENESKNTPENVIFSIQKLQAINFLPSKIILITADYHMRRAYLTFKASAQWKPMLIRHPVPYDHFNQNNYFYDFTAWQYVFFEYVKMYSARLMGNF